MAVPPAVGGRVVVAAGEVVVVVDTRVVVVVAGSVVVVDVELVLDVVAVAVVDVVAVVVVVVEAGVVVVVVVVDPGGGSAPLRSSKTPAISSWASSWSLRSLLIAEATSSASSTGKRAWRSSSWATELYQTLSSEVLA